METMSFEVYVLQRDIDEGECRLASKCMHVVAITRTLHIALKGGAKNVRVTASGVTFNYNNHRWHAVLPKRAIMNLKKYDNPKTTHLGKPHKYKLLAVRKGKVQQVSRERQDQINEARRARVRSGTPDKKYASLHERVIGL
jgi:hypothetical protein